MGLNVRSERLGPVSVEVVEIPPGSFRMGSPNELFSETPPHEVTIGRGFLLGRFPVTQEEWMAVTGSEPSRFRLSRRHPVENVSWDEARGFCQSLCRLSGRVVRLPSEAEWEYSCRGGTIGELFFSARGPFADDTAVSRDLRDVLRGYAWFDENSGGETHPVGLGEANPFGLHDILGNVWEWCEDTWHASYAGAPLDGSAFLSGSERQPRRCVRGGAWDMNAFRCRSSYRSWDWRDARTDRTGLRVVVEAQVSSRLSKIAGAHGAGTSARTKAPSPLRWPAAFPLQFR